MAPPQENQDEQPPPPPHRTSTPTTLAFEPDTAAADEPDSDISYDLNLRRGAKQPDADDNTADAAPRRRVPPESVMLQKFKDDLEKLPDDQGFDEFKDIPVRALVFGKASIGKNNLRISSSLQDLASYRHLDPEGTDAATTAGSI